MVAPINSRPGSNALSSISSTSTQPSAFNGTFTKAPSLADVKAGKENLKLGHEGPAVAHLQTKLRDTGYLPPNETIDGRFGPKTKAAVESFQKDRGLTPPKGMEGQVGPTSLAWLDNGGKKPGPADGMDSRPAPKPAPVVTQPTPTSGAPAPWDGKFTPAPTMEKVMAGEVLKLGQAGPVVAHMQGLLQKQGYLDAGETLDGRFGPKTKAAVESFQKDRGLTPPKGMEGQVGKTTLQFMEKGAAATRGPGGLSGKRTSLAPTNMSMKEQFDYYSKIIKQNGGQVNPGGQATVLGMRGVDINGNHNQPTINGGYKDTFVVLTPDGKVHHFSGTSRPNPRYDEQGKSIDINGDGYGDLGMLMEGNYSVKGFQEDFLGDAGYEVMKNGSLNVPAYRNVDGGTTYTQKERDESVKNGYTASGILFHQGGSGDNWSMGCQTIPGDGEFERFKAVVGGRGADFNYTLINAYGSL